LLDLPEPPTAIFAMSDEMAFGVLKAIRERQLIAGSDVSVIGFDDHPVSEAMGLTTVRQPVRSIGRTGARVLLDLLHGAARSRQHHMPLTLVERSSTGVPHSSP
jgi:DNA-binding LacI/PurR family transcriptional regulator